MDVGQTRAAPRLRALFGAALLVATLAFAGCHAPETEEPGDADARTPAGVLGKPVVETPTGLAIADELIASFAAGADRREVEAAVGSLGGEVVWQGPRTGAYVLRFETAAEADAALASLRAHPSVIEVRRQSVGGGTGVGTSPGLMDVQWNLWGLWLDPYEDPGDAPGVTVSILDTGAAYESRTDESGTYLLAPDLAETSFLAGWDFIHDDPNPNDDHGHGTHVTGIIAASSGITPLAAGADIMPVKVLDASNMGTEIGLAEGIYFAAEAGADVVNMSLSFSPAFFPSRFLQDAVGYAAERGVVMVAAVGNHGVDGIPFPAAFRDVIAVGASRVAEDYRPSAAPSDGRRWNTLAPRGLAPAAYGNRGFLVDVSAPGGSVDGDADGDGNPEAIVAQSFLGDPTSFEYLLFAGTSQAAAQVTAIAARLLSESPSLSPATVRAHFGETTLSTSGGNVFLDQALGRGYMNGAASMGRQASPRATAPRDRYAAFVTLSLEEDESGARFGNAQVEVLDQDDRPAARVWVYGTFTGGVHEPAMARTDASGRVSFVSSTLPAGSPLVGFQVDAVAAKSRQHIDRPTGVIRIDSCSLLHLAAFAADTDGTAPLSVATEGASADSLQLLNFSFGLATVPMAVAVDRAWLYGAFPGAAQRTITTSGQSGLQFGDDVGAPEDPCLDLVVRTFSSPFDVVSPVTSDPDGSCQHDDVCAASASLLLAMWLGEAPDYDPSLGLSSDLYAHFAAVVGAYAGFQVKPAAAAVGRLESLLSAAGLGLVPYDGPQGEGSGVTSMSH